MTSDPRTVASAAAYWNTFYNTEFRFGHGTEQILDALATLPAVRSWVDVGSGSESLLWATALRFEHLTAADIDPDRLRLLRALAETAEPRAAYRTALELGGRTAADFADRCGRLTGTLVTDCLARPLPPLPEPPELITQFGLLGLTRAPDEFTDAVQRIHAPLAAGGWCAGANWVRRAPDDGRVRLSAELFRHAFTTAGLALTRLTLIPSLDPQFPTVWSYLGRRTS